MLGRKVICVICINCPYINIANGICLHDKIAILFLLLDFSLTEKAATLIFISGCGSAISSAKEGKSGFIKS